MCVKKNCLKKQFHLKPNSPLVIMTQLMVCCVWCGFVDSKFFFKTFVQRIITTYLHYVNSVFYDRFYTHQLSGFLQMTQQLSSKFGLIRITDCVWLCGNTTRDSKYIQIKYWLLQIRKYCIIFKYLKWSFNIFLKLIY